MGIIDGVGIGPVQRADKPGAQMRLHRAEGGGVGRDGVNAELAFCPLGSGEIAVEHRGTVIGPEITDRAQQLHGARFLGELHMLGRASRDQRAVMQRHRGVALGLRVAPIVEQRLRQARQSRKVVIDVDGAIAGDTP